MRAGVYGDLTCRPMRTHSARAMVLEEPRALTPRELPIPTIGDDDGLLWIEACGLCGTDHEQYTGLIRAGFPFIPGHEIVGVIEQLGQRAADRWGVAIGDRVAVEVFQSCRACAECVAGRYRRCERHGLRDMYGFVDVSEPPGLWGGYATHLYLAPDAMVLPVPDGLDPVIATLFNPLGAGIRWGVTLPDTQAGAVVAVLGPGVRGLSACAAAKDAGAALVLVTGYGGRDAERLAVARAFGADVAVDVEQDDPVKVLRDATGGRLADVVVDVTAKAPAALGQAVRLAYRRDDRARRHAWVERDAGLRSGPHRVQGTPVGRCARRRLGGVRDRARVARRVAGRSPICPGVASVSTGPPISSR